MAMSLLTIRGKLMSVFYIEYRELSDLTSLSWDIAHHMYTRYTHGSIIVVTDRPLAFLSSVSKQWYKVVRQVQRERSSTLQASRIRELSYKGVSMEQLRMTAKLPKNQTKNDVFFVTPQDLLRNPPKCQTLYIATELANDDFARLTTGMPYHSLIVRY